MRQSTSNGVCSDVIVSIDELTASTDEYGRRCDEHFLPIPMLWSERGHFLSSRFLSWFRFNQSSRSRQQLVTSVRTFGMFSSEREVELIGGRCRQVDWLSNQTLDKFDPIVRSLNFDWLILVIRIQRNSVNWNLREIERTNTHPYSREFTRPNCNAAESEIELVERVLSW